MRRREYDLGPARAVLLGRSQGSTGTGPPSLAAVPGPGKLHCGAHTIGVRAAALSPDKQEVVCEGGAGFGLGAAAGRLQLHRPELKRDQRLGGGEASRRAIRADLPPPVVAVQPFALELAPADPATGPPIAASGSRIPGHSWRGRGRLNPRLMPSKRRAHRERPASRAARIRFVSPMTPFALLGRIVRAERGSLR